MNWAAEHRLDGTIGRIVDVTPGPSDQPATVIEVGQTWTLFGATFVVDGIELEESIDGYSVCLDGAGGLAWSFASDLVTLGHLVERQG